MNKLSELDQSWGPFPIRLALGIIFMAHGSQKLFGWFGGGGLHGTAKSFADLGIKPELVWAVVVAIVEFFGGLAVICGLLTFWAASFLAITMIVAIIKVHWPNGFFLAKKGYEYNLILLASSVSLMITGPGRLALDRLLFKKR